jgi:hypothetical protein
VIIAAIVGLWFDALQGAVQDLVDVNFMVAAVRYV